MKLCNACKTEKELLEFRRDNSKISGRQTFCRECKKIKQAEYRKTDKYKNKIKALELTDAYREKKRAYESSRKSRSEEKKKYYKLNPLKTKAKSRVLNELRSGRMVRGRCEVCNAVEIVDAHHDDYSKPLDVRWLCRSHHMKWHKLNGAGLNG